MKLNISVNVFISRFRQFLRDVGIELNALPSDSESNQSSKADSVDKDNKSDVEGTGSSSSSRVRRSKQSRNQQQEGKEEEENIDKASKDKEENLDALLFERITINSYNRSAHGMFSSNKKRKIEYVETEVNYYLSHGHVFMRNVSVQLEVDTTQRFRHFLVKYGELVNFSCHNWGNIMFVLYGATESEKCEKVNNNNNQERSDERRKVDRKQLYKCTVKDGVYILECPYRFKVQDMIEFLSTHVEITLKLAF